MKTEKIEIIASNAQCYGVKHSRRYKPSPLAQFLIERDDNGNMVKLHSDVYLLLHQKNIEKYLGADALRNYINQMISPSYERPDLSDDELMQLIPPKDVNNLTTSYQYCKYLQEHSEMIKQNYKNKLKENEVYEKMYKKLFNIKDEGE